MYVMVEEQCHSFAVHQRLALNSFIFAWHSSIFSSYFENFILQTCKIQIFTNLLDKCNSKIRIQKIQYPTRGGYCFWWKIFCCPFHSQYLGTTLKFWYPPKFRFGVMILWEKLKKKFEWGSIRMRVWKSYYSFSYLSIS